MKKDEIKNGVSLFGQSDFLIEGGDPLEEIFALKKVGFKTHLLELFDVT